MKKQEKAVRSPRDQQEQGLVITSRLKEQVGNSGPIPEAAAARRERAWDEDFTQPSAQQGGSWPNKHPDLLLLPISCQCLPLAKPNQKPESKGDSWYRPRRSASWISEWGREGWKVELRKPVENVLQTCSECQI